MIKEKNKYRSKDEKLFAKELEKRNIPFQFEKRKFVLLEGKKTNYSNYRQSTYTPDFIFEYDNRVIVVEIKGFSRGDNTLKNKLADYMINEEGMEYYVVKLAGTIKDNTRDFYFYKDKGRVKLKNKIKTFWERIGIENE